MTNQFRERIRVILEKSFNHRAGRGDRATLTSLQEQQFNQLKVEFKDTHSGQEFPLRPFAESVYERRLRDDRL